MKKRDESITVHDEVDKGNNQLLWMKTGQKQSLIEGRMLHEEVLVEILSKLPAKSLIRFTCVSKEWYALIKSSYFIARHLHRSRSANNACSLLVSGISTEKYNYKTLAVSLLIDEETTPLSLDVSFLPNYTSLMYESLKLVGSSNGLVCCYLRIKNQNSTAAQVEEEADVATKYMESILVWNPATKQFRYLPEPIPLPLEEEGRRRPQRIWGCCQNRPLLGFDFIQEINQYKVMRVFPEADGDDPINDDGKVTFRAQVFLQSTNSWREAKNKLEFPSCKTCITCYATTSNGVFYWLVQQMGGVYSLVSFSLHGEVFHVMHLPKELCCLEDGYEYNYRIPLFSWNNSAAILASKSSSDGEDYVEALWVISSSSSTAKPTWVEQFRNRSKIYSGSLFVGVWKDRYILCQRQEVANDSQLSENLFVYDPRSNTKRKILSHGEMNKFWIGVNYVESLVPV